MNGPPAGTAIESDAAHPSRQDWRSRLKKALGPVAVVGVMIAKFFAKLKFIILPAVNKVARSIEMGVTSLIISGEK